MGSSKKQTVSYWYHPFFQLALHEGPFDKLLRIRGGDVDAWTGELTASGSITINATNLWGGEEKEGGIEGTFDVMFGEMDAEPNLFFQTAMGPDPSNHNGVALLQFNGGRYGAGNPYPKAISVLTERILAGWLDQTPWYPEKAAIPIASLSYVLIQDTALEANGATTTATDYREITGLSPADVVVVDIPEGQQYGAWSAWSSDDSVLPTPPPVVGRTWWNAFQVTHDGGTDGYLEGPMSETAEEAFLDAQADLPIYLTGSTFYRFWLYDPNTGDNRGGMSLRVRKVSGLQGMNPAHVIYDSLAYLQGEPIATIDETSFQVAADTLFAEGFGICTKFNHSQETIEQFRQRILDLIGAECSRYNGKWYLDLIRELSPTEIAALPVLTDDDILDWQEDPTNRDDAVNQVAVKWFDPDTKQSRITPHVHALAAINTLGSVNAQVSDYPEVPYEPLALRLALRDLRNKATPTRRLNLTTNRTPYNWRKGRAFRLQSARRGIADMVCRVADIDRGTLQSGAIRLVCVQDIFAMPETSYVVGQAPIVPPSSSPTPVQIQWLLEAPYVELASALSAADLAALDAEAGYVMAAGVAPPGAQTYALLTRPGSGDYERNGVFDFCPAAVVVESAGPDETEFTLAAASLLKRVELGSAAFWGEEMVRVDALDAGVGTITLARGCGDTVPRGHAAGERIVFHDAWGSTDGIEYAAGETVQAKLLTRTGTAELAEANAPTVACTLDQRAARPYPPQQLRINGLQDPGAVSFTFDVSWVHRDRVLQADTLVAAEEASVGPEPGTTYTVRLFLDGVLEETVDGITGDTLADCELPANGTVRVEVEAVRDGLVSWQFPSIEFPYTGELTLSGELPDGFLGFPYTASLTVTGGAPPYSWSMGAGAPDGLAIDPATGEVSGTPTVSDTFVFDVTVEDAEAEQAISPQSVVIGPGDPHWSDVVSLLHFDGDDESTSIIDQRGKIWTARGTAKIDTAQSKFGGAGLWIGDTTNNRVDTPGHADYAFGTGDFTIQGWVRPTVVTAGKFQIMFDGRVVGSGDTGAVPTIYLFGSALRYHTSTADRISGGAASANAWQHVAYSRVAGVGRLFLGGVMVGSWTDSTNYTIPSKVTVGNAGHTPWAAPVSGWCDEWEVTKGVGRYTTNFTPPAVPSPG